jgi:hypothetical protein
MSRWGAVPGGGVKGKTNPIYWIRRSNQDAGYRNMSNSATERWNERWSRLGDIQNILAESFIDAVWDDLTDKEYEKMDKLVTDMQLHVSKISCNMEGARQGDLSKYATRIKNAGVFAIKMCIKYEVYNNIESVEYNTKEKMIYLDSTEYLYLGT